ncbi:MAG: sensor histidine kinase [bacterium]
MQIAEKNYKNFAQLTASLTLVTKWLAFKLILCIGLVLVIWLILFLHFKNCSDRNMMIDQMKEEAYRLSDIIKRGTRYDMLHARSDDLQKTIEDIGKQEDVRRVRIIEEWRIKRSSYKKEIGVAVNKVDREGGTCCECHLIEGKKPVFESFYRFFMSEEGEPVLGFVNPIYNEKDCQPCHGTEKEILGVLDVILSMEKVHKKVMVNQKYSLIFILSSFLIVAFTIAIFIMRFVNKPIKQLSNGMLRFTQGELDYNIPNPTKDEIGELARSFNRMTVDLRTYEGQLIHAKEYMDDIIKSLTDTLIVVNPDGIIKMVNQATLDLLKYESEEELLGQPMEKIFAKYASFFGGSNPDKRIPKTLIKNHDTVYRTKQGIEIPINLSASTMRDREGNTLAIICVARVDKQEYTSHMVTDIINTSIAHMEDVLVKDGIKIQTSYEPGLPKIKAKAGHLEQVFINLIINAQDALNKKYPQPDKNKMIKIDVKAIEKEGSAYIRILFSDNGVGIDKKHLNNIFDPFFTTKRIGNGTGLGLSISSWIVTDHKGKIEVINPKGCQTTFIIDLPAEMSMIQTGQKVSVI